MAGVCRNHKYRTLNFIDIGKVVSKFQMHSGNIVSVNIQKTVIMSEEVPTILIGGRLYPITASPRGKPGYENDQGQFILLSAVKKVADKRANPAIFNKKTGKVFEEIKVRAGESATLIGTRREKVEAGETLASCQKRIIQLTEKLAEKEGQISQLETEAFKSPTVLLRSGGNIVGEVNENTGVVQRLDQSFPAASIPDAPALDIDAPVAVITPDKIADITTPAQRAELAKAPVTSGSALLDQIRQGTKLKSAQAAVKVKTPVTKGGEGLLAEIRKGKPLRKTEPFVAQNCPATHRWDPKTRQCVPIPKGTVDILQEQLKQRRKSVEDEKEDEEETTSDWDRPKYISRRRR